jgi:AraC-like DNA-binding protein
MKLYLEAAPQQLTEVPNKLLLAMKEMKKREHLKRGVNSFIELSNYSQSHLTRLMKKYFNTTIQSYILNLKLDAAYHDFLLTSIPAEEICEEIGFKSFSHFHKVFKEKYGITPAALRKTRGIWTT